MHLGKFLIFISLLLIALCIQPSTIANTVLAQYGAVPRFEPSPCPMRLGVGVDMDCGYVVVPLEHSNPSGPTVRLAVGIFRTSSPTAESDPVIYLAGGPGSKLLDQFAGGLGDLARRLQQNRDLIVFDQRGMGYSEPALNCPEVHEVYAQTSIPAQGIYGDDMLDATSRCYQRLSDEGITVAAFNTLENAADVPDIIAALGYDTYNLYGGSYGSMLGLTLLRNHPEGIRSAALTSISPPQVDVMAQIPVNMQRTLEMLYETCQAQPTCAATYPPFTDLLSAAVSRFAQRPAEIQFRNPYSGQPASITMDASDIVLVLYFGLYSPEFHAQLPLLLSALVNGQSEVLAPLVEGYLATNMLMTDGALFAMRCMDDLMTTNSEAIEAAVGSVNPALQPGMRGYLGWWQGICDAGWSAQQVGDTVNTAVESAVPVLLLSGKYDPITPAQWGALALETLPASYHLVFPASGHGAAPSACMVHMLGEFLDDPTIEPDSACIDRLADTQFVTP
ncbi:MAG: alpha/beta fold hydrolase [Chloroflexi bacterium]|nr:alpha/beta fold hydrolase [Chloroflexota bacterium]